MSLSQNTEYRTIEWDILNLEAKGKIKVNNSYSTVKYLVNYIQKHTNHLIEYVIINNEDIDADDEENRTINKITFVSYYVDVEQIDLYPDQKFYKLGLINLPILIAFLFICVYLLGNDNANTRRNTRPGSCRYFKR